RELAEEDGEHGVGVPLDLRKEGREVVGVERYPDLLDDLSARLLERPLEAAYRLPSERVIRGDRRDLPVLRVLDHPVTEDVRRLARVPSGARSEEHTSELQSLPN